MTPRERGIAALSLKQPDDIVPTFELEFQLTEELLGRDFVSTEGLVGRELKCAIAYNAELHVAVAERLDYSILRTYDTRILQEWMRMGVKKTYLLCAEADGTMHIPDGAHMTELAMEMKERPNDVKARLDKSVRWAIDWGAELIDAGADVLTMCADYCFNDGPFLSPAMFAEFVTPYLGRVIAAHRKNGAFVIKHTDGNIMPVIDQILDCEPHALHSLDPQAGVDIAEIKARYGSRICLCGNVNCGLLQTGTDDEVRRDCIYSITHGKPNGGYIFCTSNVAFKGMPLERYQMILDLRRLYGRYDGEGAAA